MPLSSAVGWVATPHESPTSRAAETGPSTLLFRRESTESMRSPPPMPSAFRSGPFWIRISLSQAESWVSGRGRQQLYFVSVGIVCVYLQNKVSNCMNALFHRPYNEAEAAGGGEDVQGAD